MKSFKAVLAGMMAAGALLAFNSAVNAQAIITNGTVRLGVRALGDLNQPGGPPTVTGQKIVGVRFTKPGVGEFEYTSDGCTCEGWGVADAGSGVAGFADSAVATGGLTNLGFVNNVPGVEATSHVKTSAISPVVLDVTQYYHPSASANLYQNRVTIKNIGADVATDLRYVRVMDWDIEPTVFSEFVTIGGLPASALIRSHDNGFATPNPLGGNAPLIGATLNVNFTHIGPTDHGAYFQFAFGALAPGESKSFDIFYGGDVSVAAALADLGVVSAEVYSLGEPNGSRPPGSTQYTVSIFGFKGVGGTPVPGVPEPGTWAMMGGSLLGLGILRLRRSK